MAAPQVSSLSSSPGLSSQRHLSCLSPPSRLADQAPRDDLQSHCRGSREINGTVHSFNLMAFCSDWNIFQNSLAPKSSYLYFHKYTKYSWDDTAVEKLALSSCIASEITRALCLWDAAHAAYVPIPRDKTQRTQKNRLNSSQNCLILFSCYCCLSLMTRARGVWLQWAFDQNPERFQSPVASSCISLLIMQTGSATQEPGVIPGDSYKPS